jgi:hypothetical protein
MMLFTLTPGEHRTSAIARVRLSAVAWRTRVGGLRFANPVYGLSMV